MKRAGLIVLAFVLGACGLAAGCTYLAKSLSMFGQAAVVTLGLSWGGTDNTTPKGPVLRRVLWEPPARSHAFTNQ